MRCLNFGNRNQNAVETCMLLDGFGYIGSRWAKRSAATKRLRIVAADLKAGHGTAAAGDRVRGFLRQEALGGAIAPLKPELIFSFAAVHREPGHPRLASFETNLLEACHAVDYADSVGCSRTLFTSSIVNYGPNSENKPTAPTIALGISELKAKWMSRTWQVADCGRRLVLCHPGGIYGLGDLGNNLRIIRTAKRGYFVFPSSRDLRKSSRLDPEVEFLWNCRFGAWAPMLPQRWQLAHQ